MLLLKYVAYAVERISGLKGDYNALPSTGNARSGFLADRIGFYMDISWLGSLRDMDGF